MLKRQESSLSSSRRQAAGAAATTTPPPATHHAKSVGCMSGIIHLFSKYQTPNKRLTFGRKQEKRKPPSPTKSNGGSPAEPPKQDNFEEKIFNDDTKRLTTCGNIKVPRSPTLPPEMRWSTNAAASSPENQRNSPSLVARLMGLEDMGAAATAVRRAAGFDPVTEKRQRLLQALEKCNEDLESLKTIIKAVQTADVRLQPPHAAAPEAKRGHSCIKKCTDEVAEEGNIPVGVVDELTRSPIGNFSAVPSATAGTVRGSQQRKPTATPAAKKPGEDEDQPIAKLFNKYTSAMTAQSYSSLLMIRQRAVVLPPWSSRAMVQSVEEVCGDIAWGEKREIGRIGLGLQDHLCRELIDDLVKDLLKLPMLSNVPSLPLEACKRRLCF